MVKKGAVRILSVRFIIPVIFLCGLALLPQIVQCAETAVGTVTIGGIVFNVAVTPDGKYAYATNLQQISLIDTVSNRVTDTISMGGCDGIAIAPDGIAYILNSTQNPEIGSAQSVTVLDTATKKVTATIALDGAFSDIAVAPAGDYVYVAEQDIVNMKSVGVVTVINTATDIVTKKVAIEGSSQAVAVTPNGEYVYVTSIGSIPSFGSNQANGTVSVIDTVTDAVIATVKVGVAPQSIAIAPDGKYAYVTNFGSNSVSVIDIATNTVATTITDLPRPLDIAITPNGEYAYVTEQDVENDAGRAAVIDTATNTVTTTVELIEYPYAAAITPNGAYVYVANGVNGTVSVIDTATNAVLPAVSASAEFSVQWLAVAVLVAVIIVLLVVIIIKRKHRKTNPAGAKSIPALIGRERTSADVRLANQQSAAQLLFFVF